VAKQLVVSGHVEPHFLSPLVESIAGYANAFFRSHAGARRSNNEFCLFADKREFTTNASTPESVERDSYHEDGSLRDCRDRPPASV
jgi:hypothetical protein